MNKTCMVLLLSVAASAAYGQTAGTTMPAKTKPAAAASGSPAAKSSKQTANTKNTKSAKKTSQKSAMASPMAPKKTAAVKVAKPKAAKKTQPEATPKKEEAGATTPTAASGKRRDPFISPVLARIEGLASACQGGGPRCLAVNEIVLRGVVRTPSGMVAVVENAAQRTYFLHENTPIYNGFVEKITPDSVVFKEHYLDNLGHDSQREVVKTVNAPVV